LSDEEDEGPPITGLSDSIRRLEGGLAKLLTEFLQ